MRQAKAKERRDAIPYGEYYTPEKHAEAGQRACYAIRAILNVGRRAKPPHACIMLH